MVEQWHVECRILAFNEKAGVYEHCPSFLPPIIPFVKLGGSSSAPLIVVDHAVMQAVGAELRAELTTRSQHPVCFADGGGYVIFKAVINAEAKSRGEPSGLEWQAASVRVNDMQSRITRLELRYGSGNIVYPDNFHALRMIMAHEAPGTATQF